MTKLTPHKNGPEKNTEKEAIVVRPHLKTQQHLHCRGVNISERKSGTEKKKRKKRYLVPPPPPGGATGTVVHRLEAIQILPELR